jgi:hypothetical protein
MLKIRDRDGFNDGLLEEELPAEREVPFQSFLRRDASLPLAWGARVSFELIVTASSS